MASEDQNSNGQHLGHYAFVVGHDGTYTGQNNLLADTVITNNLRGMTAQLSALGYKPVCGESGLRNPSAQQFKEKWNEFAGSHDMKGAKVVVFYFCGHGGTEAGLTYLLMHDKAAEEQAAADEARLVNWDDIVVGEVAMKAENVTFVSILDCCRSNAGVLKKIKEEDPEPILVGLLRRYSYEDKDNTYSLNLSLSGVKEDIKNSASKMVKGLLLHRSNQFVFWYGAARGQKASGPNALWAEVQPRRCSFFTQHVVKVLEEERADNVERGISWMHEEVQKGLIRGEQIDGKDIDYGQSSFIEMCTHEQFFLDPKASRKHAVRRTYEYQAELQDEYNVHVAPIMERLRKARKEWGDLYPEVFFAAGGKAALGIRADLRALWAFWRRVQECVKLNTIDADVFFTGNWLGRAREYRELGEPLDIVNWYFVGNHFPKEKKSKQASGAKQGQAKQAPAAEQGQAKQAPEPKQYMQLRYIGKVSKEELVDNKCRPGRFFLIQQQEVIQAAMEIVLMRRPPGKRSEPLSAEESEMLHLALGEGMANRVEVALTKDKALPKVDEAKDVWQRGKGWDQDQAQPSLVAGIKERVETSLLKVKELDKVFWDRERKQLIPWLQNGTISEALQGHLSNNWNADKRNVRLDGVKYDLSDGKPEPTGSLSELERAMERLTIIVSKVLNQPKGQVDAGAGAGADAAAAQRVRDNLQHHFKTLSGAFNKLGLDGTPA